MRGALVLLAACGRVGFDGPQDTAPLPGDIAVGDGTGDSSTMTDAPPGSVTYTFGEAPATMFKNVTRDTFISNEAAEPGFNYGADNDLRIERDVDERVLIAFDLAMLPSGATVVAATLDITLSQVPLVPSPINIHRMLESWDEGSQSGSPGVANFTTRSGATSWSSVGAGEPSSSGPSIAQFTPAAGRLAIALPVSLISAWVSSPNHGVVLLSTNDSSTRFVSREGQTATDRPVLTITFVP